jgi:hypothetical protein
VDSPRTGGTPDGLFDGAVQGISLAPSSADSTDFNVLNFGAFALGVYGSGTWNYSAAVANKLSAYNNFDINYINDAAMATLILTNRVTDDPPDKDKEFTFTLYFKAEDGNAVTGDLAYTGGVIDDVPGLDITGVTAPDDSVLTLTTVILADNSTAGMAAFTLKHGQLIEIEVPAGSVRIVQQTGWPYKTSYDFTDDQLYDPGRDTGYREIEEDKSYRANFYNAKDGNPPTGIVWGHAGAWLPLALIPVFGIVLFRGVADLRRLRARRRAWR